MKNRIRIAVASALIALFTTSAATEAQARCHPSGGRYYSSCHRRPVVRTRVIYRPVIRERIVYRTVPVSYGYGRGYGYSAGYGYGRGYGRGYYNSGYRSGCHPRSYSRGYNSYYSGYSGGAATIVDIAMAADINAHTAAKAYS